VTLFISKERRNREYKAYLRKNVKMSTRQEAVKEAVEEERMENFLRSIPLVSKQEMEDISKSHGKPAKKKEPAYGEEIEL